MQPLVSIICLTFNQNQYVRECLDSLVGQKTNFDYEILIYDDASSDGTDLVLKEYKEKYSEKIHLTIQEENQFSQGKGYVGIYLGLQQARGKYIAYCEGDDYWCDEYKLQKQVNFLDSHPDFVLCVHETKIQNEKEFAMDVTTFSQMTLKDNLFFSHTQSEYNLLDTFTGNIFHISSILIRNISIKFPVWMNSFSAFDMSWYMLIAERGKIYWMSDIMSVYRIRYHSLTSSESMYSSQISFLKQFIHILRLMNKYMCRKYQERIYKIISRYYMHIAFLYLRRSNRNRSLFVKMVKMSCRYSKKYALKSFVMESSQIVSRRIYL